MKYKKGDLVRIKPKTWWNELEKDEEGDAIFNIKGGETEYFTKEMADDCCGVVGEIISSNNSYCNIMYLDYWFMEDWIEEVVEKFIIPLKQLKNEI